LIFSSSAAVYGPPKSLPISEHSPVTKLTPYGSSKLIVEDFLTSIVKANKSWKIITLRYFNPIGAHESGLIGELPKKASNNLLPFISKVAAGELPFINVYGGDYDTSDGTCIRDYIHVVDLAHGHLCALEKVLVNEGHIVVNLGTGNGYSVLEIIKAFEMASSSSINYKIAHRRLGDVGECYTNPTLAKSFLGWQAKFDLFRMCEDAWRWKCSNPNGFDGFNLLHQCNIKRL